MEKNEENHGEKSTKHPLIIYNDLKFLLEKISTRYNNSEKSSTTKKIEHTLSGYLMFTQCSFDAKETS